jgi:hypothetical protein
MLRTIAAAMLVLALTGVAWSQDLAPPGTSSSAPSGADRRWAETLAPSRPMRLEHFRSTFDPAKPSGGVNGYVGEITEQRPAGVTRFEGVRATYQTPEFSIYTIEKLTFATAADAGEFVAHHVDIVHGPVFVEQRGEMVVVVRVPALGTRPELTVQAYRDIISHSWKQPSAVPDVVAWFDSGQQEGAVIARSGPAADAARRAYEAARQTSQKYPNHSARSDDGSYLIRLRSGFTGRVWPDRAWFTRDPARAATVEGTMAALGKSVPQVSSPVAPAAGATRGATSVLDRAGR